MSEFAAEDKLLKTADELNLKVSVAKVVANIFKQKVKLLKIEAKFYRCSYGNCFHLV